MVAETGFEPTTSGLWASQAEGSEKSLSPTLSGLTALNWCFVFFSRLKRSVGICLFCISSLISAVIWRSLWRLETAVENRVKGRVLPTPAVASTRHSGHAATARRPRASWDGHDHRATHNVHASLRIIQRSQQQTPSTQEHSASQQTSSQHSHGQPPRMPCPVSPWERRLAHGRSSARAAKTFPIAASTPREIQAHPRFAFPLALPLSRRHHPYHKARQGSEAQHEDEDSHGKEHLPEVARGNPRVPEAQGRRDPGGELGARLGQHRLHCHGRRKARLRGHRHQVRGLRRTQGGARPEELRAHRRGIPRRGRGGGSHQHPLRHREPLSDGLREDPPAPAQERSQRREVP